jgi:hypothetical protein
MEDLGEADVILNIKLVREGDGDVTLLQSHYVENVLSRFGYSDWKPAPTPYHGGVTLLPASLILSLLLFLSASAQSQAATEVCRCQQVLN